METLTQVESLLRRCQHSQALALLDAAGGMEAGPAHCLAYGVVLRAMGRPEQAALAFQRVLRDQPGNPRAMTYLGMIRLLQGRMAEGWAAYRARWDNPDWPSRMMFPREHLWDGKPRPGLRLLLWSEQGYGDAIQFSRFVPWLAAQGVALTFLCPPPLQRLFAANWKQLSIISAFEPGIHEFDVHLPLMDLPAVWQGPLPAVPVGMPYLAVEAGSRVASGKPRIGVAWGGRPTHPEDYTRSIPARLFDKLLATHPEVDWVGLQHGASEIPPSLAGNMAATADFLDLAGVVAGLDMVITVDTALAHLAGAMGKPVWVMLARVPDWRWGMTGEHTGWYPTMRLFRQEVPCDWDTVLDSVGRNLPL